LKRRVAAFLSVPLLLCLLPGTTLAIVSAIDQQQTGIDTELQSSYTVAQTFTAHRYGPLAFVDLYMGTTGHAEEVDLQGTTGSPPVPDGVNIATSSQFVGGSSLAGTWITFGFPSPILLPGHVYALVISPSAEVVLYGSSTNSYPGGAAYHLTSGGWTLVTSEYTGGVADYAFRTWMATASPTPTPTPHPTHTPTHAPTHTPGPTPTASPTAPPTATPAAPTSALTATPAPSAAASSGSVAGATGSSDPNSGGSGGTNLLLVAAIGLVLILLAGGGGYLLARKRSNGPADPGGPHQPPA
jgi:hypothetical protein